MHCLPTVKHNMSVVCMSSSPVFDFEIHVGKFVEGGIGERWRWRLREGALGDCRGGREVVFPINCTPHKSRTVDL